MNETLRNAYRQRFDRVFDYIDEHLYDELTVEQLSNVACFSRFHFLRQFTVYTGISLFGYIRLLRLKQASYRLAINTGERITDIAFDIGFESSESFSRAFKNTFGLTPSQFRKKPAWQDWAEKYRFPIRERRTVMDVKIVNFPETRIALIEHRGDSALVMKTAMTFIDWRRSSGLSPVKSSRTFGIAYDDPEQTPPADFRFDICGSVSEVVPENPQGVRSGIIPGGRCAVVRHYGSHERIGESARYLYRQWLPDSGEELRDFPLFFDYLNLIYDTAEKDLVTDLYLPLR